MNITVIFIIMGILLSCFWFLFWSRNKTESDISGVKYMKIGATAVSLLVTLFFVIKVLNVQNPEILGGGAIMKNKMIPKPTEMEAPTLKTENVPDYKSEGKKALKETEIY